MEDIRQKFIEYYLLEVTKHLGEETKEETYRKVLEI